MPTYQYRCNQCSTELEVVQKFTDDPLTVCPECGGPLRKVFSPVGVMFKGSGFYVTDSRSKPQSSVPASGKPHEHTHGEHSHTGHPTEHADTSKTSETKTSKPDAAKPAPAAA